MAIYRAQISFLVDGNLPVDAMTINPHYFGDDAQAIANVLKNNLSAFAPIGPAAPFTVKMYDAEKPPPSYPLATVVQAGTPVNSIVPRELSLCLSYYSTFNRPRLRGRLYLPSPFITGSYASRPTGAQVAEALSWNTPLTQGLPSATNMVVWSRRDRKANGVSDFWVDDEWDIVRSRGRKPTSRATAPYTP
jgi:hypothetical protein